MMDLKKKCLFLAVTASILAGGACQSALADGNTLVVKNKSITEITKEADGGYFKENGTGNYELKNANGDKFDSIQWENTNNYSSNNFINSVNNNSSYNILTNKLTTVSRSQEESIFNLSKNTEINIGKQGNEVKTVDIKAGYGRFNTATISVGGINSKINFFVDDMVLNLNKDFGVSEGVNKTALGIIGKTGFGNPYYSTNCQININANNKLVIEGDIGNGFITPEGSITWAYNKNCAITVNNDNKYKGIVQLTGDIYSANIISPSHNSSEYRGNYTSMNFLGKESFFTGKTFDYVYDMDGTSSKALDNNEGVFLKFSNGAKWNVTEDSQLANLSASNGSIIDLTYDDNHNTQSARAANNFKKLYVYKDFDGDGAIVKMNIDGTIAPQNNCDRLIVYGTHNGTTQIEIKNIGSDYSKALNTVLAQVVNENGSFEVKDVENGITWTRYEVDRKDGSSSTNWYISNAETITSPVTPVQPSEPDDSDDNNSNNKPLKPTTTVSTLLSTVTSAYDTWRNDADKLNERMGELRLNGKEAEGVWVRTKGSQFGRHGANGAYANQQHTYQLGYDVVTSKDEAQTTYTGVVAEYGKGSLSFARGTGTMRSFGLGVYQTQLRESGHYLDFSYKFDKYKNDFHVADTQGNSISGKYGNNAMSLSAEYGRKNALKHSWYIEPQAEMTLGYMWGNDFTTSNHIKVEQKNMPALIGRLGLNIGREVNDKMNFYVKASINHDFLGKYDVNMTDLDTGVRLHADDSYGSSCFDYGAGFSVKTGKDSYAYFDIERAMGGEYKKNWDWNAGLRWTF